MTLIYLLFIGRGYQTSLIIWRVCDYLFVNTQFWNNKLISGCEWETYESYVGTKIWKKSWGKSGGQKVIWSSTFY